MVAFDKKMAEIVENTDVVKEGAMDQMVSWATGVVTVDPLQPASAPTRSEAIDLFAQKAAAAKGVPEVIIKDSSSEEDEANTRLELETLKVLEERSAPSRLP